MVISKSNFKIILISFLLVALLFVSGCFPDVLDSSVYIDSNPSDVTVNAGENAIFVVEASCDEELGFQWWRHPYVDSSSKVVDIPGKIEGATTNELKILDVDEINNGESFVVEVYNVRDHEGYWKNSLPASLTVVGGSSPFCGDGNLDSGEECDDGNTASGDGCSSICETESFLGSGTTYYVSTSGNDNNDGTSESTPWKTLKKIRDNVPNFKPGDNILFKRGDEWREFLEIKNLHGEENNYITFGAYGTGEKPIITAMIVVPGTTDASRWIRVTDAKDAWSGESLNNIWKIQFETDELSKNVNRITRLWINEKEYCRTWDREQIIDQDVSRPSFDTNDCNYIRENVVEDFGDVIRQGEWNNQPDNTFRWRSERNDNSLEVYSPNGNPAEIGMKLEWAGRKGGALGSNWWAETETVVFKDSSFFKLQDLDIQGGRYSSLKTRECHDFIIDKMNIGMNSARAGLRITNDKKTLKSYNVEVKNSVFDSGYEMYCPNRYDTNAMAINIFYYVENVSIHDNKFRSWSQETIMPIGINKYAPKGPNNIRFFNNYVNGGGQRYARSVSVVGENDAAYEGDATPTNIFYYNNYFVNTSTRSQVSGINVNIHHNIWESNGPRTPDTRVMHHTNSMCGYGMYGLVEKFSEGMGIISGGKTNQDKDVNVFNNVFSDISSHALTQWSDAKGGFYANNLIVNAPTRETGHDGEDKYRATIRIYNINNRYSYLNNFIWNDQSKYPSFNNKYIEYGEKSDRDTELGKFPNFWLTVDEWNDMNGVYGDTIQGNKLLDGSLSSIMNPDFTLPATSPAINAGVDISEYMEHVPNFRDRNGNLVDLNNPDVGAYQYE